jgi:hypothetical protein
MTSQTRYFIELSDLTAWRFQCKSCHASLELALDKIERGVLNVCPNCRAHWALIPTSEYAQAGFDSYFTNFLKAVLDLKRELGEKSVLGFSMTLEIKQPPPES